MPISSRGKRVLELAMREALDLQREEIGTEHLLLGILREGDGAAVRVLVSLGVRLAEARERVIELAAGPRGEAVDQPGREPRCPACSAPTAGTLRSRMVTVPADPPGATPTRVTLVWCGACGAVVGMVPA